MRGPRDPITALQRAIRCLPPATRDAMLHGIKEHPIVAGAYTDGRGGICPMLAAHRHGGRTTHLGFSRAWDALARTDKVRRATPRELRILEDLLLASLESEPQDFAQVIREHRAALARRAPEIEARRLSAPSRSGRRAAAGAAARTAW
jgi:hypothetical protein